MTPRIVTHLERNKITARQAAVNACLIIRGKKPENKFIVNPEVYDPT